MEIGFIASRFCIGSGQGFESLRAHHKRLSLDSLFLLMDKYHVYRLHSKLLDRYDIGSTQDITKRLEKHLSNHKGYTSRAKDWLVVYSESYLTKSWHSLAERSLNEKNKSL